MSAPLIVVSPHLGDAVFGCGALLGAEPAGSGATVLTVFAGLPPDPALRTPWDARSGFASGGEAMAARRQEDCRALALLAATPLWLDFVDAQYGPSPPIEKVADALGSVLDSLDADTVLFPLGLHDGDHELAHEACVLALRRRPRIEALAYEDAGYRRLHGCLQWRLATLAAAGVAATPSRRACGIPGPRKAAAVLAYASQLRAFGPGGWDDTLQPERYWRIEFGAARG
jgi:LmbE family N-acetylglucosaminyl deacetylase